MKRILSKLPSLIVLYLVGNMFLPQSAEAQYYGNEWSWVEDNSEAIAQKYVKKKEFEKETHLIYDYKVRFVYEWDEDNQKPKVEEEGEITVLSLMEFSGYYGGLFQNDNADVSYVYGVRKGGSTYSLPVYKRSYESSSIFHQDGEYVGFRLPYEYSTFGEVMRYKYQITHKDLKYLTKSYLQRSEFVKTGTVEVWIPEWIETDVLNYNFSGFGIKRTLNDKEVWTETYEKADRDGEVYTVIRFEYEDMPARVVESGSPGTTHYVPHIVFLNKGYERNGESEELFRDMDGLYKWCKSLVDNLIDEPSDEIKAIVDGLVEPTDSDKDKLRKVFYWVQSNIRYIAFEDGIAGFQPEDAEKVCNYRYGDCKGMANLAKMMLKYLGFDARLTWIGTRHVAYDNQIPTLSAANHMICTVFLEGEKYFIDPTEEYVSLGDYAHRIQGRRVMIEDDDSYILEKVPEFDAYHNRTVISKRMSIKDGVIFGNAEEQHFGEGKTSLQSGYSRIKKQSKKDALVDYINNDKGNLIIKNVETSDLENREIPVELKYGFELRNKVVSLKDELFLQLDFDQELGMYFFDDDRKTAYEFDSKYYKEADYILNIPEGYKVKYLPKDVIVKENGYSFTIKFEEKNGTVRLRKVLEISDTIVELSEMKVWNQNIEKIYKAYDEYLILARR